MKVENRKSVYAPLKVFHPGSKEYSFIEVTEWTNGEGWDITIDEKQFGLHMDELTAINFLTTKLEIDEREQDKH